MPAPARQIQLPLRRAAEIALKSLRVRATRSLLTLLTIVMAMAFLTHIWTTRQIEAALLAQASAAAEVGPPGDHAAAIRTVWLLSLSLLVCLVGISNAMLMNVMERFREIGTMKCLGALDSFILKLFFLESLFLGATGTVIGAALGSLLTLVLQWSRAGSRLWAIHPWPALGGISAASVAIGLAITAAAALYPAWKAARMQPVEAMRIET